MDRDSGSGFRKKRKTSGSSGGDVYKRGSGLKRPGGKPVGNASAYQDRRKPTNNNHYTPPPQDPSSGGMPDPGDLLGSGSQQNSGGSPLGGLGSLLGSGNSTSKGCGSSVGKIVLIIVVIVVLFFVIKQCSKGSEDFLPSDSQTINTNSGAEPTLGDDTTVTGDPSNNNISPMTGITGPRTRRTQILGDGKDVFTIMVYMCGTDLESDYGMATADINEMLYADPGENLNIIIETGGTSKWKNTVIKSNTNQRYQIVGDGLVLLDGDVGKKAMTDPNTLSDFVSYCAGEFPANRYALIFWDHGGGSLAGYGYDQLFPGNKSMTLDQIYTALDEAGVAFDFVGFDACLMGTVETAYMLNYHADYLIASEELEPGIGWYYTDWIRELSKDTSMSTLKIGQNIIDSFITACQAKVPRDIATLAIVDLVELNNTGDQAFRDFALSADAMLDEDYKIISDARGSTREFNRSRTDQVDLIHLAENIDSPEAKVLADAMRKCIKYNRTTSNIMNANGLSVYFPYDELKSMSSMVSVYDRIGMGEEYTGLVKKFGNMVVGGQISTGSPSSPLASLLGGLTGSSGSWSDGWSSFFQNPDFSSLLGGSTQGTTDWVDSNFIQSNADYYENNYLNASDLELVEKDGGFVVHLSDEQWDLIQKVELNVFFDDGEGYIDLGIDNIVEFDDDGDLVIGFDGTWVALDKHIVAFYLESVEEKGSSYTVIGQVPALLNGQLVDIIVMFTQDDPYGYVAGARINYGDTTDTMAKGLIEIQPGDVIDFLCDYYSYDEQFDDSYYLGDQMIADGELTVSYHPVGSNECMVTYRLTDMYNNAYWTPAILYQE
ncbi:MAG: peptidase C11 [Clostridiales bacterium]|nr:peptidase C11 [Clostridiales bacterium]